MCVIQQEKEVFLRRRLAWLLSVDKKGKIVYNVKVIKKTQKHALA